VKRRPGGGLISLPQGILQGAFQKTRRMFPALSPVRVDFTRSFMVLF
jgi:hypothetical protein